MSRLIFLQKDKSVLSRPEFGIQMYKDTNCEALSLNLHISQELLYRVRNVSPLMHELDGGSQSCADCFLFNCTL